MPPIDERLERAFDLILGIVLTVGGSLIVLAAVGAVILAVAAAAFPGPISYEPSVEEALASAVFFCPAAAWAVYKGVALVRGRWNWDEDD